jgi:colanic acid biosynthesis glycosyl transferase WcaI
LKTLIVTNHFYPVPFRINDLALELRDRGHSVSVMTALPDYPAGSFYEGYSLLNGPYREKWNEIDIHRFPVLSRGGGSNLRLVGQYLSSLFASTIKSLYMKDGGFDVIFVFVTAPLLIAQSAVIYKLLHGTPIVTWVTDLWPEQITAATGLNHPAILTPLSMHTRWLYSHCDRVLYSSEAFCKPLSRHIDHAQKLTYLPYWAEDHYWQDTHKDSTYSETNKTPEKVFNLVFAGNLGASQNLDVIVAAAKELGPSSNIQFTILGDGRERNRFENAISLEKLQSLFRFMGWVNKYEVPAYFFHADALLMTLTPDPFISLTLPSKLQSYLAYGKPIIASANGPTNTVLKESGAGICAPANDGIALANAIREMARKSEEERSLIGAAGKRYCKEKFDKTVIMDRLESILNEVAQSA